MDLQSPRIIIVGETVHQSSQLRQFSQLNHMNTPVSILEIKKRTSSPIAPVVLPQVQQFVIAQSLSIADDELVTIEPETIQTEYEPSTAMNVLYASADRPLLKTNLVMKGNHLTKARKDGDHAERIANALRIKHQMRIKNTKRKVAESLEGHKKQFFRQSRDVHMPLGEFFNNYSRYKKKAGEETAGPILRHPFRNSNPSRQRAFQQSITNPASLSIASLVSTQRATPSILNPLQSAMAAAATMQQQSVVLPSIDDPWTTTTRNNRQFDLDGEVLAQDARRRKQFAEQMEMVTEESMYGAVIQMLEKSHSPIKPKQQQQTARLRIKNPRKWELIEQPTFEVGMDQIDRSLALTASNSQQNMRKSPTRRTEFEKQESRETLLTINDEEKNRQWLFAQQQLKYDYLTPNSVSNMTKKKVSPPKTTLERKQLPAEGYKNDKFVIFKRPIFYKGKQIIDKDSYVAEDLVPRIMVRNELLSERKQKRLDQNRKENLSTLNAPPVTSEHHPLSAFQSLSQRHLLHSTSDCSLRQSSCASKHRLENSCEDNKGEFSNALDFVMKYKKRKKIKRIFDRPNITNY